ACNFHAAADKGTANSCDSCNNRNCVCNVNADFNAASLADCGATARSIACSERDAISANDAERNAATNGCKFARCQRHHSFNSNSVAIVIASRADRLAAGGSDSRAIQISG